MNLWERVKTAVAMFRVTGGVALPRDGRSSEETINGMLSAYLLAFSTVSPIVDFTILETLKKLSIFNPDVSQYMMIMRNVGNPGHQLQIDAANDTIAEAAVKRLNESASRIYTIGTGVDGLINQYFDSVSWSGAISSEDVVNLAARRVEKVVMVPVERIRFKYNKDLDVYEPYQRAANLVRTTEASSLGLIKLNTETYKYYALSTIENSPYAKPPATAAVEAILCGQVPIMENIRFYAQKIGMMGFVDYSAVGPAKKAGDTSEEHAAKLTQYIKDLANSLDGNLSKGMLVHTRDQKVEHTPVTTGAAGVYDVHRMSEEYIMSGLGPPPAFFGRTDSTTETFATVVYGLLLAQVGNMQRLPKRRMEQTYRLDLRLAGIEVDGISLAFDKAHSRDPKGEAETDEIRLRVATTKVKEGLISPNEAAQELGYDNWFDEGLITANTNGIQPVTGQQGLGRLIRDKTKTVTLRFDKASQRYRHQPDVIYLGGGEEIEAADNVIPIIKKKALAAVASN